MRNPPAAAPAGIKPPATPALTKPRAPAARSYGRVVRSCQLINVVVAPAAVSAQSGRSQSASGNRGRQSGLVAEAMRQQLAAELLRLRRQRAYSPWR